MRQYTLLAIGLFLAFNPLSTLAQKEMPPINVEGRVPSKDRPRGERGEHGDGRGNSGGGRRSPAGSVEVKINEQTFKVPPKVKAAYEQIKLKANEQLLDNVPNWKSAKSAALSAEVNQHKVEAYRTNDLGAQRLWNHVGEQLRNGIFPLNDFSDYTKNITLPPLPGETYRNQPGFEYSLKPDDFRKLRQVRNMIIKRPQSASAYYLMLSDFMAGTLHPLGPQTKVSINGRDRLLVNKALLCLPESEKLLLERQWLRMSRVGGMFTAPFWSEMHLSLRSLHLPFNETNDDRVLFDSAEPGGCEPAGPRP